MPRQFENTSISNAHLEDLIGLALVALREAGHDKHNLTMVKDFLYRQKGINLYANQVTYKQFQRCYRHKAIRYQPIGKNSYSWKSCSPVMYLIKAVVSK